MMKFSKNKSEAKNLAFFFASTYFLIFNLNIIEIPQGSYADVFNIKQKNRIRRYGFYNIP